MTKIFLLYLSVICAMHATAVTDEQRALIQSKLLASGLDCIKDHPLSLSDIQTFKNKMLPKGEDATCFAACLFKKIGIMDETGKLDPAGAVEKAKEVFTNGDEHLKKADEIVSACSSVNEQVTSDDERGCERAKLAFGCLTENAAKFGFEIDF